MSGMGSGYSNLRTGVLAIATTGTELPLLGVTFSTGTITATDGSDLIVHSATGFSTTNSPVGFYILTVGGKLYRIEEIVSTSVIRVFPTVETTESAKTFQIYEILAGTGCIELSSPVANTAGMYVGLRGAISKTLGFCIPKGATQELKLNMHPPSLPDGTENDLWVDTDTSGDVLSYAILY